jgi:hypothetical protein
MSEAIDIRLQRARSWLRKASGAASHHDIDAQFIFLWIAFNALYGTPRYHDKDNPRSSEINDFKRFLGEVEKMSCGAIGKSLKPLAAEIESVMRSPFLDIESWKRWDKEGVRDRQKRVSSARNVYADGLHLDQLFLRIYTLRNQLLHGAATDGGQRNRESLKYALPILLTMVRVVIDLVDKYRIKISGLEPIPFPPSLGEGGRFNVPRLKRGL